MRAGIDFAPEAALEVTGRSPSEDVDAILERIYGLIKEQKVAIDGVIAATSASTGAINPK